MKRINFIILVSIMMLFSCNSDNIRKDSIEIVTGLITCVHNYDDERTIQYYQEQSVLHEIDERLSVYDIKDINYKHWYINNFEMENYKCTVKD